MKKRMTRQPKPGRRRLFCAGPSELQREGVETQGRSAEIELAVRPGPEVLEDPTILEMPLEPDEEPRQRKLSLRRRKSAVR